MVILGAGGFAKEIATVLLWNDYDHEIVFFDNVSSIIDEDIASNFKLMKNESNLAQYFKEVSSDFCLGVGSPINREKLFGLGVYCGGKCQKIISNKAIIGQINVNIGSGTAILSGVTVTASIKIGQCCVINKDVIISHDVTIGDYVEVSPGVRLLGKTSVGNYSSIGTNAVILPNINIGKNCVIGAGSVVTKDVPDNTTVIGIPAKQLTKVTVSR